MMQRTSRLAVTRATALLLAGALAACSDAPTGAAPNSEATLAEQVAALGFRADMIEDHGDFVLVEGDIYLSKAQLRSATVGPDDPMSPKFQYRTTNLVTSANVHDIRVDVSGLASEPGWQAAAREALTHWSGIPSSYVLMVEGGPADITVAATCTSSDVAAYASFPASGNVGPTIYVNSCFGYSTSHAQKVHNMVHELGHTLGFRHTNYVQNGEAAGTEGAAHVPGTPTSGNDPGSVMNGGTALNSWAGFSAADVTATQALYPVPPPPPPPATITVTNSGGYPLVSWAPVAGATSYTVRLVYTYFYTTWRGPETPQRVRTDLGTTTGTSFLDTTNPYSGESSCTRPAAWYEYPYGPGDTFTERYQYAVVSHLAGGTTSQQLVWAPIAECY